MGHVSVGIVLQVPTLQVPTEGELGPLHVSLIFQKQPKVYLHTFFCLRLYLGPTTKQSKHLRLVLRHLLQLAEAHPLRQEAVNSASCILNPTTRCTLSIPYWIPMAPRPW